MPKTLTLTLCSALLSQLCASTTGQQLIGIASDGAYSIDPLTGSTGLSIGQFYMQGAADGSAEGIVYARTDALELLTRLDLNQGTVTQVGSMLLWVRDLAHDHARQKLYGTTGQELVLIQESNAASSVVATYHAAASSYVPAAIYAIAWDHARDRLLGIDGYALWEINPSDGFCTFVGLHGLSGLQDIHVDMASGRIFGCCAPISELVELSPVNGDPTHLVWLTNGPFTGLASSDPRSTGVGYCSATANSSGSAAVTEAYTPGLTSTGSLTLVTTGLPPGQPVLLMASQAPGWVSLPAGSTGNLCLIGNIASFRSHLTWTDGTGRLVQFIDTTAIPTRPTSSAVQPGDLWHFQAWYRDEVGGSPTSNFSLPIQISFQ